eukprot:1520441-Pyramimonas_sp.AAC.1
MAVGNAFSVQKLLQIEVVILIHPVRDTALLRSLRQRRQQALLLGRRAVVALPLASAPSPEAPGA